MSSIVVRGAEKINSLVWFRNDLRIYDHSGLTHAIQNSNSVIGVYFFNPDHFKINELGFPKMDSFRAQFLIDSVKNLEKKYCKDSVWWENSKQENDAVLKLYMSWPEKETVDLFTLILFLDATTPPIFNKLGSVGWVPTITLTSHIRGFPSPGPLKVSAKTEFVTKGFMEEDREIWDSDGKLVGQSKQMAKLRMKK